MPTTLNGPLFGHQACGCGRPVLDEVAYKTGGRCAECYRAEYSKILEPAILRTARNRLTVGRVSRGPSERRQRKQSKSRRNARPEVAERNRKLMLAQGRARIRLSQIFPEIYELLLADERADLGLQAWSIDRAITPYLAESTLNLVATYHRLRDGSEDDHPAATA